MLPPNVIHLAGEITLVNHLAASGSITPGLLVQLNSADRYEIHAVPGGVSKSVALDQNMLNRGVDDAYTDGDLIEVGVMHPGATAWMLIAPGQNITDGDMLESAGDGTLCALTSGAALFQAIEDVDNGAGPGNARIRVEAL